MQDMKMIDMLNKLTDEHNTNIDLTWNTVSRATTNVSKLLAGRPSGKFHLQTNKS